MGLNTAHSYSNTDNIVEEQSFNNQTFIYDLNKSNAPPAVEAALVDLTNRLRHIDRATVAVIGFAYKRHTPPRTDRHRYCGVSAPNALHQTQRCAWDKQPIPSLS
jgi:hypothetical protein